MIQVSRILCPVDFSEASARALRAAGMLARWYDAEVVVPYVATLPLPPTPFTPVPVAILSDEARAEVLAQLEALVAAAATDGVAMTPVVLEGSVVDAVLAQADEWPADLIVMGTHGRSGFDHLLMGSITERVLRKTARPVLTVREGPGPLPASSAAPFRSILCPIDFSPASLAALQYALSLSQESGGQLTLLHVPDWAAEVSGVEVLGPRAAEYQKRLGDEARLRLQAAVPDSARSWCNVDERVTFGRPWEEILDQARRTRADLIVIGAHGREGVLRHLLGSTTDHVVRAADCPVLTVRELPEVPSGEGSHRETAATK